MNEQTLTTPHVYSAIRHVMEDMAKSGVGKNQRNVQQNFAYRGVDDVMDALAPSLARHALLIIPHVRGRAMEERESRSGGKLFHCTLEIEYDFIACADGSKLIIGPIFGEAMDSGDKATPKAMAIAYKYAVVQTFCIPITGDDPDANSHEIADAAAPPPRPDTQQSAPTRAPAAPAPPPPHVPSHEVPVGGDGKPRVMRSGGNFGYGKKHAETPWNLMTTRDLEWFLGAERTPPNVRQKIAIELAWRDYDDLQLDAARDIKRQQDETSIAEADIPYEPR